jgi:hypothetical protein
MCGDYRLPMQTTRTLSFFVKDLSSIASRKQVCLITIVTEQVVDASDSGISVIQVCDSDLTVPMQKSEGFWASPGEWCTLGSV